MFDQSRVSDVRASPRNADLAVSWASTAPAGTVYQVYVDRRLAWHGAGRSAVVPHPAGPVRIEVGTVLPGEASLDLSAQLPAVPGGGSRVALRWLGGSFLDPGLVGFRVYSGSTPGGAVDYSHPVGSVTAYPQGVVNDGFGLGPFGQGGFGRSAGTYSWASDPLTAGAWHFAVKPFNAAGNEGTAVTWTVTVVGPPRPVARNAAGVRLTYQVNSPGVVSLHWLASPGA